MASWTLMVSGAVLACLALVYGGWFLTLIGCSLSLSGLLLNGWGGSDEDEDTTDYFAERTVPTTYGNHDR